MKRLPVLLFTLSVIFGLLAGVWGYFQSGGGRILGGVQVDGLRIGGLTVSVVREKLLELERADPLMPLRLLYPGGEITLEPSRVRAHLAIDEILKEALALGRRGGFRERFLTIRTSLLEGVYLSRRVELDKDRMEQFLDELAMKIDIPLVNARFGGDGRLVHSSCGRRLDTAGAHQAIISAWESGKNELVLPVETLERSTTSRDVEIWRFDQRLGGFATSFDSSDEARTSNIILAAAILDGIVVKSSEVFSFNEIVGPRTPERGYREAPEIVNQELVRGVGGGICQVSSTLYNAALLSGMEIVERRNHSRPLGYVAIGRDATVYYDSIDLKFRNVHCFPIVIRAQVTKDKLNISFWGQYSPDEEIEVVTGEIERIPARAVRSVDPSLPPGQEVVDEEGTPGYRLKVYRVHGSGERELISTDFYPPRPARIRISKVLHQE